MTLKQIFGYFNVFNIEKHRDEYPWNDREQHKHRFILTYVAPQWMWKWFECVSFDNIYMGTPEDSYDKRTCLIFSGSKNNYWIFFRHSPISKGDWKWCLKFMKTGNDHVYMG